MFKAFELSLLNAKGASKAVEKLIDVVAGAVGRLYTPVDKILNAHADAKCMLIMAQAKEAEHQLSDRTAARIVHVEERRQENIDAIVQIAASSLPGDASETPVETDWAARFFESCKDVGNPEMRQIWGRILASEVTDPGSFSRRTLDIVRAMDRSDADIFTRLCTASFEYANGVHGFFVPVHHVFEYIRQSLLTTEEELHMKTIGLLSATIVYRHPDEKEFDVDYFGEKYELRRHNFEKDAEDVRLVTPALYRFTRAGEELASIAGAASDQTFIDLWRKESNIPNQFLLRSPGEK